MRRLVLVTLFVQIGLLLLVMPWSVFWDRNYFAQAMPGVQSFISNDFVRGAVSGLGLVNLYFGLAELVAAITERPSPPSSLNTSSIRPRE